MAQNQVYLFLVFTINGIIIGVIFDLFRILRKSFKSNDIITYIEDIVFWVMSGLSILFCMYKFSDGELRGYTLLGIIIGSTLYFLTVSTYIIKISVYIINKIKIFISLILNLILYPLRLIYLFIKKLIFKPISIVCINIRKEIFKILKSHKKLET